MSQENKTKINVMDLDDDTLELYSLARFMGLIKGGAQTPIGSLVEGAQLVLSFGREDVLRTFSEGLPVELSLEDKEAFNIILSNQLLLSTHEKIQAAGGLTQENIEKFL